MPPLGRRHSSSSQTVCASSVRLSVEQSRVICRIRSNSSGFNSRPQNDRPPPMVTGMMWSLLVAGPHAYLTEISRKCPEKSLPIPRYRSGLHSVLQLANLQAQALACEGTTSVLPTITAGIKGFSPGPLSCEISEAITELVTCRSEPLFPWVPDDVLPTPRKTKAGTMGNYGSDFNSD